MNIYDETLNNIEKKEKQINQNLKKKGKKKGRF